MLLLIFCAVFVLNAVTMQRFLSFFTSVKHFPCPSHLQLFFLFFFPADMQQREKMEISSQSSVLTVNVMAFV